MVFSKNVSSSNISSSSRKDSSNTSSFVHRDLVLRERRKGDSVTKFVAISSASSSPSTSSVSSFVIFSTNRATMSTVSRRFFTFLRSSNNDFANFLVFSSPATMAFSNSSASVSTLSAIDFIFSDTCCNTDISSFDWCNASASRSFLRLSELSSVMSAASALVCFSFLNSSSSSSSLPCSFSSWRCCSSAAFTSCRKTMIVYSASRNSSSNSKALFSATLCFAMAWSRSRRMASLALFKTSRSLTSCSFSSRRCATSIKCSSSFSFSSTDSFFAVVVASGTTLAYALKVSSAVVALNSTRFIVSLISSARKRSSLNISFVSINLPLKASSSSSLSSSARFCSRSCSRRR
mmetsp:Transcript_8761/g.25510  ORF Transcript_8761/g.25510 Transcript_8761/m.25510 type:complete len:349 (-) Transcript_8761:578-1624(-)